MGSAGSPKTLPLQGLLLWLFLLACPECQADVQVSVPAVMDVLLGDPVSILCTHTVTGGDGYLLVEWFITDKNGEQRRVAYSDQGRQGVDRATEYTDRVSMDPSHSLVIQAAAVSDERAFSCQVTSTSGNGMGVTQLKVYDPPEPPELVQNSGSVSVIQDHASEIATCNSNNANPVPTVSWYKDGRLLNASTERNKDLYVVSRTVKEASGLQSVSSTLYLRVNKADKDSTFLCKVSYSMPYGKVGSAESEPFQLKVHYYTENVHFALDSPKVIKEGDDVRLQCKADGFPEPEYFFTKLQKLTPGVEQDMGSSPTGTLHLPSVTKDSSGTYRCQVLDFDSPDEVELEQEVTIFVNYLDPLVMNPSEMVTANLSANLKLTCLGTGSQAPMLSWWKGKEPVGSGETLVLDSLTYHKAGTYTCQASVPSIPGLQQNESVQVVVEGKPEIEQHQPIGHYHSLGQTVMLTCSALGHPQPEIRWSVSGKEALRHSGNKVIGDLSVEVTPELVQSGVKCRAENNYGSAEQTFQLEIVDSEESQGGSTVAVIAVCVCVLLLLLIVGFFYFMQRRGQLPCGGGEKRSLTPREGNPDDTVVEMKTDKRNEQTGLLSPGGGGGGGGTNEC
ncbi:basal cell adhesion molecule isoform X2 [Elgaria multicarinata webbii]|uniref:basal cell adhesion molecule isoform X2 n=1 Tax=Elgaria multicarinata webbii TaxID=159646 RepID=UPI002FCCD8CE